METQQPQPWHASQLPGLAVQPRHSVLAQWSPVWTLASPVWLSASAVSSQLTPQKPHELGLPVHSDIVVMFGSGAEKREAEGGELKGWGWWWCVWVSGDNNGERELYTAYESEPMM